MQTIPENCKKCRGKVFVENSSDPMIGKVGDCSSCGALYYEEGMPILIARLDVQANGKDSRWK